jgi:transposase
MEAKVPPPKVLLADRGYDANRIRDDIDRRGGVSMIPGRKTRKVPIQIDEYIYALRNRVERTFSKLKCSRRLATRYDKTADSYLGFVHICSIRLWIRNFVNRT